MFTLADNGDCIGRAAFKGMLPVPPLSPLRIVDRENIPADSEINKRVGYPRYRYPNGCIILATGRLQNLSSG